MAQMKEQIKTPEKELRDKEIDNLSDAEFKTLVISMLTEFTEYSHKIKEEDYAKRNKEKPTVKGRRLGLKSTIWNKRKK